MMKVALKTLGCRLNEAELQTWARGFQDKGLSVVTDATTADLLVLNTCAVTGDAVRKSRNLIRRSQRNNPNARLVVSGCYSSLDESLPNEIEGIDLIVPNKDKDRLVEITTGLLDLPVMPSTATAAESDALFTRNRSRAFIKIQDGCRYRCTFCIVTVARGEERSLPVSTIVENVNQAAQLGINEVVLTGVHAGGYGSDNDSSLVQLIQHVLNETDIRRVRMGSVEPWDLGDDFIRLFDNPRFMPHLHLPLQSGCDTVLKRMARRCRTGDFASLVETLRNSVADFQVTTDIIVGFPGETEKEWQTGFEFIQSIGFSHMHIFSYSPRSGTAAANMSNAVKPEIKKQRSQQLHALMHKMKQQALLNQAGQLTDVLWESGMPLTETTSRVFGYTPNYSRVFVDVDQNTDLKNCITRSQLVGLSDCGEMLNAVPCQVQELSSAGSSC